MATTNANKAKAAAAKTGYEKLMEGATKKEYVDTAKQAEAENVVPAPTPMAPIQAMPSAPTVRKVEPIVERATPATMPLSVATQAAGMSEGTVMVRCANGRIKPMASGVALKMQTNYPNEFKIVS